MTHEWHPADKAGEEQETQDTLGQRLKFYYGPKLPEQPLSESSWEMVSSQLASQQRKPLQRRSRRRWHLSRSRLRRPHHSFSLHAEAHDAFTHVLFDAHIPYSKHLLLCRSTTRIQMPNMRVSLLSRQPLRLNLPIYTDLKPVELDVLLASGLAQYEEMRRPASILIYMLSTPVIVGLVVWTTFTLFWQSLSLFNHFLNLFTCIVLIGIVLRLLHTHARNLAQKADTVMVRWIGRYRACQGLHALADRSRVPSQRRLGELSLTERIAHVCGTRIPVQEERFTLVR